MRKAKAVFMVLALIIAMAMPLSVVASTSGEPVLRHHEGEVYIPLRLAMYAFGATVEWNSADRAAVITLPDGETYVVVIAAVGGFVENGVAWVPFLYVVNELTLLFGIPAEYNMQATAMLLGIEVTTPATEIVDRIDLTLWDAENFADVREASFSTDLPYGVIAVNFIEYISDNLGARSAFTYRELETAVWIVEELLAMGHDWDNIEVQEFTYWEIQDLGIGLTPLRWSQVTAPHILGVGRNYQLRADRVSQNVILTIPGQSYRKIVVGAHYDSPPYASASDNASGTALLLESAQRMLEADHYYTIVYVFFGSEEVGLIGAYYYYERLSQAQRDNIVMMVNADVLIEGPYVIYGAASAPELTEEVIPELQLAVFDAMEDMFTIQYEILMAEFAAMGIDPPFDQLGFDSLEALLDLVMADILGLSPELLLLQASMLEVVDPVIDPVSAQVTVIAAYLTNNHDFELLSLPEYLAFPSDHLVFLFAGHPVVNLVGLERYENVSPELAAQLTRLGEGGGEFTGTILHTPLDEFHTIEALWPGMMNANLEAFIIFLQEILMGRFS